MEAPGDSGMDVNRLRRDEMMRAVEAILFAAEEPVTSAQLADVVAQVTGERILSATDVDGLVEDLDAALVVSGRALRVRKWAGGYRLATSEQVSPYVKAYFQTDRSQRLSRSLLETLAIVAYRQPVTRPEIDFVRGVDSDYGVRKLMELNLVDVVGRSDAVGRPLLYGTTRYFLEQFGLEDLNGLPTLREVEEILNDSAFDRERARLLSLEQEERAAGSRESVSGEQLPVEPGRDS